MWDASIRVCCRFALLASVCIVLMMLGFTLIRLHLSLLGRPRDAYLIHTDFVDHCRCRLLRLPCMIAMKLIGYNSVPSIHLLGNLMRLLATSISSAIL